MYKIKTKSDKCVYLNKMNLKLFDSSIIILAHFKYTCI